jgi:hypothetical protein
MLNLDISIQILDPCHELEKRQGISLDYAMILNISVIH